MIVASGLFFASSMYATILSKLRSSMTLFALADPDEPAYDAVLARFFDGEQDERTPPLLH